jgi:hypothetical protein
MNLTDERLKELDNPSLTRNERSMMRCRLASELFTSDNMKLRGKR